MIIERIKYITNRDLLAEIHNSKSTYCHFDAPEHARFDIIVPSIEAITPEVIEQARGMRAKKLSTKAAPVAADSIDPDSLIYRVVHWAHIPVDPTGKRRPRMPGEESQVRVPFPPFIHVMLNDGVAREVGRSHWKGDFKAGHFSTEHGQITNRLATMLMLLVDRYSRRGNWRGYCVDQHTEALTRRGWLTYDKITTDDVILSYDGQRLAWSAIRSIYRDDYVGKMFHLTVTGMDALVTPGHKFVTQSGLKPVEMLLVKDKIIMSADPVFAPEERLHDDAFVELAGWMVSERCLSDDPARLCQRIGVSRNEGRVAGRIRACLQALDSFVSETVEQDGSNPSIWFDLAKATSNRLLAVIEREERVPMMSFMLSLTLDQRKLLMDTMIDGDGYRAAHTGYICKSAKRTDAFVALATMLGHRTRVSLRDHVSCGKSTQGYTCVIYKDRVKHSNVENVDFHGGKKARSGLSKLDHQNEPTVDYDGVVWCPQTEFGCFMARRNGNAYLTGNTYVDEMRSHALLHLSQTGLQFDESKSENPFAFYTTVIRHCFTRVLNLERRNQHIRDDLLIMAGVNPSFSRQIEHEMAERGEERVLAETPKPALAGPAPVKKARGRKPKVVVEAG